MSQVSKPVVVSLDLADLPVPGVAVMVTPTEAERLGAFEDDAIDTDDALTASLDTGAKR